MKPIKFVLLSLTMIGCAGNVGGAGDDESALSSAVNAASAVTYVDADDYTNDKGTNTQWLATKSALKESFDWVCGDTFCEGDYGQNLEPISLRCSVNSANGVLKSCSYVFSGSYETINASTGTIKVNAKTWSCHVPVSGIAIADFISTLTAAPTTQSIPRPLPGSTRSVYDSIAGCLP